MNSKIMIISTIIFILFILSGIACFFRLKPSEKNYVEIVQEGKVIYQFDLNNTENMTFEIKSADGNSHNTICIENGTICICDAGCPDKICVKTGILKSERLPIVCLPNKLIIRFSEED